MAQMDTGWQRHDTVILNLPLEKGASKSILRLNGDASLGHGMKRQLLLVMLRIHCYSS